MSTLDEARDTAELEAIRSALVAAHGAVTRAADALGVHPNTLHNRIAALNLRTWLDEAYPRSKRQPRRRASKRTSKTRTAAP